MEYCDDNNACGAYDYNPYGPAFGPAESEYNGGIGRGGGKGFDDEFNDGIFRASLKGSSLSRPQKWPGSVSEMRKHTSFAGQGMPQDSGDGYSAYMERRPYNRWG
jgi:hypothetical protein